MGKFTRTSYIYHTQSWKICRTLRCWKCKMCG